MLNIDKQYFCKFNIIYNGFFSKSTYKEELLIKNYNSTLSYLRRWFDFAVISYHPL